MKENDDGMADVPFWRTTGIGYQIQISDSCRVLDELLMMEQHESEKPFHFPHRSASYEKIRAPLACLDVSFLDGLFLTPLGRVSKLNS